MQIGDALGAQKTKSQENRLEERQAETTRLTLSWRQRESQRMAGIDKYISRENAHQYTV